MTPTLIIEYRDNVHVVFDGESYAARSVRVTTRRSRIDVTAYGDATPRFVAGPVETTFEIVVDPTEFDPYALDSQVVNVVVDGSVMRAIVTGIEVEASSDGIRSQITAEAVGVDAPLELQAATRPRQTATPSQRPFEPEHARGIALGGVKP